MQKGGRWVEIAVEKIRAYRLSAHHLDKKYPLTDLEAAAGACGLQNSPPGAWETALFNRLENCTLAGLQKALYQQKNLLQAWSYRGVPVVFPTCEWCVFLEPLAAQEGEAPWIYTRGLTAALDFLQMTFDDLLPLVMNAAKYLDNHVLVSKETLDQVLAKMVVEQLPADLCTLWQAPSMYDQAHKQTVGEAVVSFMLRPCSFQGLVVFGERQAVTPTFTSLKNWLGHLPESLPEAEKALVRKYLHCYGPATVQSFKEWLGCSPGQAKRLWSQAAAEMVPIQRMGKVQFMLSDDLPALLAAEEGEEVKLLGAHDPYLDLRDRIVILDSQALHKMVWQTVANPGVVLKGGRIIGHWKTNMQKKQMHLTITLYEKVSASQQKQLEQMSQEYAAFRGRIIGKLAIQ